MYGSSRTTLGCIRTVLPDDFPGGCRAHPECVQEAHRLRLNAPLVDGLGDRLRPLLTDTRNLTKSGGLAGDDIEGVRAESLDEACCQGGADPWNQPGAEVANHALLCGWNRRGEGADPKPRPIDRVLRPTPHQANILARGDLPEVTHGGLRRGEGGIFVGREPDHRKPPVITAEKDIFDDAFQDLF